jgi:hypothetical protein
MQSRERLFDLGWRLGRMFDLLCSGVGYGRRGLGTLPIKRFGASDQFRHVPIREGRISLSGVIESASFKLVNEPHSVHPAKRIYQGVKTAGTKFDWL